MTIGAGHAGRAGGTASQAGSGLGQAGAQAGASFNVAAMALRQQHELQGLSLPEACP